MAPTLALSFWFSLNFYKVVFAAVAEIPGESIKGKQEHPVGRTGETESNNRPLIPGPLWEQGQGWANLPPHLQLSLSLLT